MDAYPSCPRKLNQLPNWQRIYPLKAFLHLLRLEALPMRVTLALPTAPTPLASPLGTGNLGSAWDIALPDTSGSWGTNLRGVRATPNGQIETVEATPQTVNAGSIILSDVEGNTVGVGVRGQLGSVRSFKLLGTTWREI